MDYTKKGNFHKLIDNSIVEMNDLKGFGYNEELINENFFSWLSGLVGGTLGGIPGSVPQLGKEYIVDWFLKTLGLDKTSYLSSVISTTIGNIPIDEYGRLFTDCRFTSETISKSIVEAFFKQMREKGNMSGVGGVLTDLLRNSVADTLFKDKEGVIGSVSEGINDFICGKLSSVNSKMENVKKEITDKAMS